MRIVVDASVALAWCFSDEESDYADAVLMALTKQGGIVPYLWVPEVANILKLAVQKGRITQDKKQEILDFLSDQNIQIDFRMPGLSALVAFAERYDLTSYDALYLYLAISDNFMLATLDRGLKKAALLAHVDLFKG